MEVGFLHLTNWIASMKEGPPKSQYTPEGCSVDTETINRNKSNRY